MSRPFIFTVKGLERADEYGIHGAYPCHGQAKPSREEAERGPSGVGDPVPGTLAHE